MIYAEIIKENIDEILENIKEDIYQDEAIHAFVGTDIELQVVLEKQDAILKKYLYNFGDDSIIDENYCWTFYKDLDIPYSVIYQSLQTLRITLMKKILDNMEDKSKILEVEEYIKLLLNSVAKVYIKKEVHILKDTNKSAFKKYLLFRSHLSFTDDMIDAIVNDDLNKFPVIAPNNCSFMQYMSYPESLMVCMDANLCTHLHDIHNIIHKAANTFYLFYKKCDYVQAYVIFKELLEAIMNFNKNVTELYFLAYGNSEESLFSLLEYILYQNSKVYLTLIDIRSLKSLNATYGEKTVNKVLKEIEETLQKFVHGREDKMLLVKGITADYYLLNMGVNDTEFDAMLDELYITVNKIYEVDYKDVKIESIVASLYMKGFEGKGRDDFTKLLLHLKKKAKEENRAYMVRDSKQLQSLKSWLDGSYQDINFISKKLKEEAIDVMFQPIFNTQSGEMEILEALVRIKDGNKYIPAGAFIDTIYTLNKIEELDKLVLKKILEYQEVIQKLVGTLFVNVSYTSLIDTRYQKEFQHFIKTFGKEKVVFELTEQNIVENIDYVTSLHKEYGVLFSVDDFGSGYSSLKTVSNLSNAGILKVLKVDESLVKQLDTDKNDYKIVDIIAKLCDSLEISSVGEFIENKEVLARLKELGITYAQGYYLSKPKLIDELLVEKLNGTLSYGSK